MKKLTIKQLKIELKNAKYDSQYGENKYREKCAIIEKLSNDIKTAKESISNHTFTISNLENKNDMLQNMLFNIDSFYRDKQRVLQNEYVEVERLKSDLLRNYLNNHKQTG